MRLGLSFFLIFTILNSYSQNRIFGNVIDENGQAYQHVKLSIVQLGLEHWTDQNGKYEFTNLPNGVYALAVDYFYDIQYFTLPISTKDSVFDITLVRRIEFNDLLIKTYQFNPSNYSSVSKLDEEWIKNNRQEKDLPFLLTRVSGIVNQSDAGNGVGYTALRMRGMDPSHIQITMNGIPFNDSESSLSYFVDIPDIISHTNEITVLKGNVPNRPGSASFGGAVDINTNKLSFDPYLVFQTQFGSFNTFKYSLLANSGLLENKYNLKFGLSRQKSDGYIDRSNSDLKSFHISLARILKSSSFRINFLHGSEQTNQAWFGLPVQFIGIDSLRTYNAAGTQKSGDPYSNEIDQYKQEHIQGFYQKQLNSNLNLNCILNYTFGKGYYESYIANATLANYYIESSTISEADLIQRKWLKNHFGLLSTNLVFQINKKWNVTPALSLIHYYGNHFGNVNWVNLVDYKVLKNRFYDNNGNKREFTGSIKSSIQISKKLNINADLQYRNINHRIKGVLESKKDINQSHNFNFISPKFYADYQLNSRWMFSTSLGYMLREPFREDLLNAADALKPENLIDLELGGKFKSECFTVKLNLYEMAYRNQLALTGAINNVGELLHTNLNRSNRLGLELEADYQWRNLVTFWTALNFSQNKIDKFDEYIVDYDNENRSIVKTHTNTDISFSPKSVIHAGIQFSILKVKKKTPGLQLAMQYHNIGAMYLDNSGSGTALIPKYQHVEFKLNLEQKVFKKSTIHFWFAMYNVLDNEYASHGWISSRFHSDLPINLSLDPYLAQESDQIYYYKAVYPQALRHFSLGLQFEFR